MRRLMSSDIVNFKREKMLETLNYLITRDKVSYSLWSTRDKFLCQLREEVNRFLDDVTEEYDPFERPTERGNDTGVLPCGGIVG